MNLKNLIASLLPIAAVAALSSCSNHPEIEGTWTGTPTRIDNISAACDASATMSISFTQDKDSAESGEITISALIDANQPVTSTTDGLDQPYEVSVAATAVITGHWSYEEDGDDDILITLDPSTLQVNVDPNGVTFSNDVLTETQQPLLDSLSSATADAWKKSLTKAMAERFYDINKISDIKVRNGIMSCEIHDRDFTFRRVSE
ncbi:MAG: hypothetical protein K2J10_01380 [Muribaculaceae bacterium]|nr:hypothetical protein [Muribaculaceae bacterium]